MKRLSITIGAAFLVACTLLFCAGCDDVQNSVVWAKAEGWTATDLNGETVGIEFGFASNGRVYWRVER